MSERVCCIILRGRGFISNMSAGPKKHSYASETDIKCLWHSGFHYRLACLMCDNWSQTIACIWYVWLEFYITKYALDASRCILSSLLFTLGTFVTNTCLSPGTFLLHQTLFCVLAKPAVTFMSHVVLDTYCIVLSLNSYLAKCNCSMT